MVGLTYWRRSVNCGKLAKIESDMYLSLNGQYSRVFYHLVENILMLEGFHDKSIQPCLRTAGVLGGIVSTVYSRLERARFVCQKDITGLRINVSRHLEHCTRRLYVVGECEATKTETYHTTTGSWHDVQLHLFNSLLYH